jgi:hypothetical protein
MRTSMQFITDFKEVILLAVREIQEELNLVNSLCKLPEFSYYLHVYICFPHNKQV